MKRAIWFGQLDIDPTLHSVTQEIVMWRAVIDQAIEDMINKDKGREARMTRLRARIWLQDAGEDFEQVCYLAQLPADIVQSKIKILMENLNETKNSDTN
tara:strand:- start:5514 stop:5810 length:297 start_codon:yes stop_codon:yes gene_type:complete